MAENQKLSKKLPKRAAKSHPKHAKRMGHREKAKKRHDANRAANEAARAANDVFRAAGLPTPYEQRQRDRRNKKKD